MATLPNRALVAGVTYPRPAVVGSRFDLSVYLDYHIQAPGSVIEVWVNDMEDEASNRYRLLGQAAVNPGEGVLMISGPATAVAWPDGESPFQIRVSVIQYRPDGSGTGGTVAGFSQVTYDGFQFVPVATGD